MLACFHRAGYTVDKGVAGGKRRGWIEKGGMVAGFMLTSGAMGSKQYPAVVSLKAIFIAKDPVEARAFHSWEATLPLRKVQADLGPNNTITLRTKYILFVESEAALLQEIDTFSRAYGSLKTTFQVTQHDPFSWPEFHRKILDTDLISSLSNEDWSEVIAKWGWTYKYTPPNPKAMKTGLSSGLVSSGARSFVYIAATIEGVQVGILPGAHLSLTSYVHVEEGADPEAMVKRLWPNAPDWSKYNVDQLNEMLRKQDCYYADAIGYFVIHPVESKDMTIARVREEILKFAGFVKGLPSK